MTDTLSILNASSLMTTFGPYLKLEAIALSGILFGCTSAISIFSIPSILNPAAASAANGYNSASAAHILSQWRGLYTSCNRIIPKANFLAVIAYAEIAYLEREKGVWNWGPWAECAVLTAAIVPYTMITMGEGIKKLQSVKVAEGGDAKGDWVVREVKKWGKLNMYRAGFHGAAVAVGIWAIAKGMERK